jgi:hypothetical protein
MGSNSSEAKWRMPVRFKIIKIKTLSIYYISNGFTHDMNISRHTARCALARGAACFAPMLTIPDDHIVSLRGVGINFESFLLTRR